jgi:hypothetical protein
MGQVAGAECDTTGGLSAGGMISQLLMGERERLVRLKGELERLQQELLVQEDRIAYLEMMLERLQGLSD